MYLRRITNLKGCLRNLEKNTLGTSESMTMIQHMKTVLTFQLTEYSFFSVGDTKLSNTSTPTIISACEDRIIPEYHIFIQDEDKSMLKDVLAKLVDWKKNNHFYSIPMRQLPFIEEVANMHGAKTLSDVRTDMYVVNYPEKISQFRLRRDEVIKKLTETDATIIDYYWKYRNAESEEIIRKAIEKSIGYGLYNKNQLVSWALLSGHGEISFLFTLPEVRERNYALVVGYSLCRHLLNLGITPIGYVELENEASKQLLRRATAFEKSIEVTHVVFCPA